MPHTTHSNIDTSALRFSSGPNPDVYSDEEAVRDLTILVAAVTSRFKGALPESEDRVLAEKILEMIHSRTVKKLEATQRLLESKKYIESFVETEKLAAELTALMVKDTWTDAELDRSKELTKQLNQASANI